MPADGCSKMFGAEWQLPFLWRLEAAPSILADPAAVALLSLCCPKLQSVVIQLPSAASQRLVGPVNLSGLPQISGLTRLVLLGVTVAGMQCENISRCFARTFCRSGIGRAMWLQVLLPCHTNLKHAGPALKKVSPPYARPMTQFVAVPATSHGRVCT